MDVALRRNNEGNTALGQAEVLLIMPWVGAFWTFHLASNARLPSLERFDTEFVGNDFFPVPSASHLS